MPRIPFRPEHFGPHMGATFSVPGSLVCGWDEIAHAAITVGRRNWLDVIQHGTYSVLEALWRLALVRANLRQDGDDTLKPSQAFIDLDRSEKGAVTYFLQMFFSKLIADRLLEVPWLLHLDVYRQQLAPAFALPMRPDFVGIDVDREWLVLESKGRSWVMPSTLMLTAKRQTRSLRNIGGTLPALRVAVGCYFASAGLSARIWDPEDYDENAIDLPVDSELFIREYYRPLVQYMDATSHERTVRADEHIPVLRAALPGMDASVQIDEDVLEWYQGRRPWDEIARPRRASRPPILAQLARGRRDEADMARRIVPHAGVPDPARLGRPERSAVDGVTVELGPSWREDLMRRQPGDRGG